MSPASAAAMRASLDARLTASATALGIDAGRLRRRLVFQRILRRIGTADNWVLKGGYLLETRLRQGFRTTRDLDLVTNLASSAEALTGELDQLLSADPDHDFFRFRITRTRPLADDTAGRGGWKLSVDAVLDDRPFDMVRLDVMQRFEETTGGREMIAIPPPIGGLGLAVADVQSVDLAQHAAEKLHALTKMYVGDRVSTRVKDLVDLALMLDAGFLPDPRLRVRVAAVFASRDRRPPPPNLPRPPARWSADFATLVTGTAAADTTLAQAFETVSAMYVDAVHADEKGST
jgi:Nucleotidyl transferase AbiEii toxin, Type IV TA system